MFSADGELVHELLLALLHCLVIGPEVAGINLVAEEKPELVQKLIRHRRHLTLVIVHRLREERKEDESCRDNRDLT